MTQARDLADGKFDTNTLVVDAANNRVGIGTTSPNGNGALTVNAATDNSPQIVFTENDTAKWLVGHRHDGDHLRFYDLGNSAERVRIQSGGGISFNGDTAAANALDDYEEGSYTPEISATDGIGTLTYSARVGRYTKVGNRVMFNAYVSINNKGTVAGLLRITTPFTPANISSNHVAIAHWVNGSQNNQAFEGERVTYAYLAPNEPIVRFYASNGDGGLNHLSAAHVKNGTDFMIQGTFQV